jgi:[NiFe] hydrogenase diaphorase moiety small subunit
MNPADTVTLTIDGVSIQAGRGQTVLEAADAAGVYVPRLCHHPDLPPSGHCRVCTVKINGRMGAACTYPVENGMTVENDTPELENMRRDFVEMMFVEGNHYCPSCEASGDCELQAVAYRLEMVAPHYPSLNEARDIDATHPDIFIDRDRCILCGRCVRASTLLDGKSVFGYVGRGIDKRIAVDVADHLGDTEMAAADRAATICPTGCLRLKRHGYEVPVGERRFDAEPIGADLERCGMAED